MDLDLSLPADGKHLLLLGLSGYGKTQALLEIAAKTTDRTSTFVIGDDRYAALLARLDAAKMYLPNVVLLAKDPYHAVTFGRTSLFLVDGMHHRCRQPLEVTNIKDRLCALVRAALLNNTQPFQLVVAVQQALRNPLAPSSKVLVEDLPGWVAREVPRGWGAKMLRGRIADAVRES